MNIAKLFQIDMGHQLLVQIIDFPDAPPNTCLCFSSGFFGQVIEVPVIYESEDVMNNIFDSANQEWAEGMFAGLRDEYYRLNGLNGYI